MPLTSDITNDIKSSQPIGIFDSGVGGLSIFNCIKALLPNEKLIYIADSLYAPYGDKPDDEIIVRVNIIADALIKKNCKALVVACNTATVVAINQLRQRICPSIPIIGVEPAIKPAVKNSTNKQIAILTTQATAKNKRFLALVDKYTSDSTVHIQPCPGLVELIENNQLNSIEFEHLLQNYLTAVLEEKADTIVLGCTHYPFFSEKIKMFFGDNINIMETALPVTEQLKRQLIQHNTINTASTKINKSTKYQIFSSKINKNQSTLMSTLLGTSINLLPFID